jgi:hypothetical protein
MLAFRKTFILLTLLFSASICNAQQKTDNSSVYVESWRAGNKIREQVLTFNLDSTQNEYSDYIRDVGINYYKLNLRRFPAGKKDYDFEYWVVQLKEVFSEKNKKEKLGCNLLTVEGCGVGDYFPKEDLVGILFPVEMPKNAIEKIYIERYYPLSVKRVIKVQNFYVLIQVNNYKMNEDNPKKLDSMNVTVEFKNEYKPEKAR